VRESATRSPTSGEPAGAERCLASNSRRVQLPRSPQLGSDLGSRWTPNPTSGVQFLGSPLARCRDVGKRCVWPHRMKRHQRSGRASIRKVPARCQTGLENRGRGDIARGFRLLHLPLTASSSSGSGRCPLTAETGIQIPTRSRMSLSSIGKDARFSLSRAEFNSQ
jgi:hypothetical protein